LILELFRQCGIFVLFFSLFFIAITEEGREKNEALQIDKKIKKK